MLGEVEVVFGFWAAIYVTGRALLLGSNSSLEYLNGLNFTEPAFVFVIMSVCSTRPILHFANGLIENCSRVLPLPRATAFYITALTIGPLLGSLITEPAAMTVVALILLERFYSHKISLKLKYATLGLLFVNISIGGTLTPYAAPPVLMVAPSWGWDLTFMLENFGWRAVLACVLSTALIAGYFQKEIRALAWSTSSANEKGLPIWIVALHLIFLLGIVLASHHMVIFMGIFLFFLGLVQVTREHQRKVQIREALLVAFFLAGLVVLGGPQRWWLEPVLTSLSDNALFFGATALTAITDNAALTYLGSQVPTLGEMAKIALVSGAVVGGGLTVVANAPNPAGYGILNRAFGEDGIKPLGLLAGALLPTAVAAICFWLI